MSDAIKDLRDYLAKSPSVVYPEDVLAYLPAIEAENAKLRRDIESVGTAAYLYGRDQLKAENGKLRELVDKLLYGLDHDASPADALAWTQEVDAMLYELGIEVGG